MAIPKPWGEEIWFTGMEARGESRVRVDGGDLALSEYLALAPQHLCGGQPPVLLKILAPDSASPQGDLYFELHAEKQEVYIVTHVDPAAWPDGRGAIRMGVDPAQRAASASDADLRARFLQAVLDYEQVRREIDAADARQAASRRNANWRSASTWNRLPAC